MPVSVIQKPRYGKILEVVKSFNPKKNYGFKIRRQVAYVLDDLEKGKQYNLNDLVQHYHKDQNLTKGNKILSTRQIIKHVMRDGKKIGIIKEIDFHVMEYEDFCKLDTVAYMRRQLNEPKIKNEQSVTKHSAGGTRENYSRVNWNFNDFLHGKVLSIKKVVPVGENLQRVDTVNITLDTIEDLLQIHQETQGKSIDVIKMIKQYLMDSMHEHKSKVTMESIVYGIKAYFEKNESPIIFNFNVGVDHQAVSDMKEDNAISVLTLDDLVTLLTTGRPSVVEKAIVLCKFQAGLDNITFSDRFNFEAWPQLIKYFGTEDFENWDLTKCPVPLQLTRLKVNFPHTCFLDKDAVYQMIKALRWRLKKTDEPMKIGQALFLNRELRPITNRGISELIPKLAERAEIQQKFLIKSGFRNDKTSHELRDLLKSTLKTCKVETYVTQHCIGHMPQDSYEKEAILYPERIREEYKKASKMLNVFTGYTNYLKTGGESDKKIKELSDRLNIVENKRRQEEEKFNQDIRNEQATNDRHYRKIIETSGKGKENDILRKQLKEMQKALNEMSKKLEKSD